MYLAFYAKIYFQGSLHFDGACDGRNGARDQYDRNLDENRGAE